ncbi:hypothetical protein Nepgr_014877 [Nepenthes gracilis]|uniref:Uncharacterized protein n=1 Tax=Nepenthes gracilis TaxID=150966 RepID=A0AAD3XQS3_NEPGR|nr:hypothetical protein Nepgr_014877 [Nepenthes gracilis]
MESVLGFKETSTIDEKSHGYKLVPWMNWDEWDFVRVSLFSSSSDAVAFALRRISAWRSRGCLPVVIEVTASIVEIQQKDPHFSAKSNNEGSESEEMLAMLYNMAIMRLVNGVIEKTRKRTAVSIAEAADALKIPRMLIDIRHEGSHRDLPSLRLLRLASIKALSWLKSYYWDPQMEAIPFQGGKSANIKKEIRSSLSELASSLKMQQSAKLISSQGKRKRGKHCEQYYGRSKILSLMATKVQSSKYMGSRKQINRTLRNLVRLYSFFSSEVVSVLLGFVLNTSKSSEIMELSNRSLVYLSLDAMQNRFDVWKPVIAMFSKKEPELILQLLNSVVDIIDSRKAIKNNVGKEHLSLSQYDDEVHYIEVLSSLFSWLVEILKELTPFHCQCQADETGTSSAMPKAALGEVVRRCLLATEPGNNQLFRSSFLLAQMIGNNSLIEKLNKLSELFSSSPDIGNFSAVCPDNFMHQVNHIHQAAEKLKRIKLHQMQSASSLETQAASNFEITNRWTVAGFWNPCPIGMLPCAVGSSGRLPVLNYCDGDNKAPSSINKRESSLNTIDEEENWESGNGGGKRRASCDLDGEPSNDSVVENMREYAEKCEPEDVDTALLDESMKGWLMMHGVWRRVDEKELQDIQSAIRILI